MKRFFRRVLLFCLVSAAVLGTVPTGVLAAESGAISVTGYALTVQSGAAVTSLAKGGTVNIRLSFKDTGHKTGEIAESAIDVTRLVDSFSGGVPAVKVTSAADALLTFDVTVTGAVYKGTGKSLSLKVGYPQFEGSYQSFDVSIAEAVEYEAPKQPEYTPETAPAPLVLISRGEMSSPIAAKQEMELTFFFQNLSNIALRSPVVTLTPSEGLMLTGGSSSFTTADIPGRGTGTLKVRVQAADTVAAAQQSVSVELRFNYYNNVATAQGSVSDKVTVPAVVTKTPEKVTIPQPPVIVTRSPLDGPIAAGQTFQVTVYFKNAGKTALQNPVASFGTSDALTLLNDASTMLLPDIAPGESGSAVLKLRAAKEIASANQSVAVDLRFGYNAGDSVAQATLSDKVNIAAAATSSVKTDSPVPNIIVSAFSYGGGPVAAGSKFTLGFTFRNTGRLPIENLVVTVDGGESYTMDGSSNTAYYAALGSGRSMTQEMPMQALPAAKAGAQNITVSFKYEYLDGQKRAAANADIKLSVPLFQPDRFQLNAPAAPGVANMGEELSLALNYVNKGKSDISNVEATIVGDTVDTPARTQYLGNFESGKSGSIGFVLTPQQEGETTITLKVSYEDPNQQVKTLEFPVKLTVIAPAAPETPAEPEAAPAKTGPNKWLLIGGGGALLLALVLLPALRKKKKKASAAQDSASWDSWDEPEKAAAPAPAAVSGAKEKKED